MSVIQIGAFIHGRQVLPKSAPLFESLNPATAEPIAQFVTEQLKQRRVA